MTYDVLIAKPVPALFQPLAKSREKNAEFQVDDAVFLPSECLVPCLHPVLDEKSPEKHAEYPHCVNSK